MARVSYSDRDDLPEEYQELIVSSLQPGKTVNVYRAVGNNPVVLAGLRDFLGALWTDSGLDDRERELAILVTAREVNSEYEWHQHVGIARDVGLSDDEIHAISDGRFDAFDPAEESLLEYVIAVIRGEVDDAVHDTAAEHYDDETIVGAGAVAAGYLGLARLIDAFGVEIETGDEFVGWDLDG